VAIEPFEQRLSRVRHRFASTLEGKINDVFLELPLLTSENDILAIEVIYSRIHGICGVGPSVGFVQTGRVAREAESVLLEAYHTHRSLTDSELASFKKKLTILRDTADSELRSSYANLR
jgi:hypothetical protein